MLRSRRVSGQKHYWEVCFGKRPADELYDLRHDPDCVTNLAATVPFDELKHQLFDELKKQDDPRMAGNGHIFDDYPYSNPADRGLYERFMRDGKARGSWASDSDVEKTPLE